MMNMNTDITEEINKKLDTGLDAFNIVTALMDEGVLKSTTEIEKAYDLAKTIALARKIKRNEDGTFTIDSPDIMLDISGHLRSAAERYTERGLDVTAKEVITLAGIISYTVLYKLQKPE